jgi:hypothetical protein
VREEGLTSLSPIVTKVSDAGVKELNKAPPSRKAVK